jgi:hypothetical protein
LKEWYDHDVILQDDLPSDYQKMIDESSSTFTSFIKKELMVHNSIGNLSHFINNAIWLANTSQSNSDQMVERVLQLKNDVEEAVVSKHSHINPIVETVPTDNEGTCEEAEESVLEKKQTCTSTSMKLRKRAPPRLNQNDLKLINRPAKRRIVVETSDEGEDENKLTSPSNGDEIEPIGSDSSESKTDEKNKTISPSISSRGRRSGKTPRRNFPGGLQRESSKLRRTSQIKEPKRFDPSSTTSQNFGS